MKPSLLMLVFAAAALSAAVPALAQTRGDKPGAATPAKGTDAKAAAKRVGDPYTLPGCADCGKALKPLDESVVKLEEGRELRFCSDSCAGHFEKRKDQALARVDAAMVKDQAPLYPLTTSVVSGKPLPEKPVEVIRGNRLVRLAEQAEVAQLDKDAARHIEALDKAATKAQAKAYPLKECIGTGAEIGGDPDMEPASFVVAGRLMKVCCLGCRKHVEKQPAKVIAQVDHAWAAARNPSDKQNTPAAPNTQARPAKKDK